MANNKYISIWLALYFNMEQELYAQVAEIALEHREYASMRLWNQANRIFSPIIAPGFSGFLKIPS